MMPVTISITSFVVALVVYAYRIILIGINSACSSTENISIVKIRSTY